MRALKPGHFYGMILAGSAAAGLYLWQVHQRMLSGEPGLLMCPVHTIAGIPCPSCGTTRSILQIISPDSVTTALFNPLGPIMLLLLLVLPVWSVADLIRKKKSLYYAVQKAEKLISNHKAVSGVLILLLALQWLWLIHQSQLI